MKILADLNVKGDHHQACVCVGGGGIYEGPEHFKKRIQLQKMYIHMYCIRNATIVPHKYNVVE